jgi:hypothetical protein
MLPFVAAAALAVVLLLLRKFFARSSAPGSHPTASFAFRSAVARAIDERAAQPRLCRPNTGLSSCARSET